MNRKQVQQQVQDTLGDRIKNLFVKNPRRIYIEVDPGDVVEVARVLHRDLGARFNIASGMEMEKDFEILYHFAFEAEPPEGVLVSVRVHLDKEKPAVDSITPGVPAAAWIEREMHELLGIEFRNHPDMRPLLLAADWPEDVYPLRRGKPWEGKVDRRI